MLVAHVIGIMFVLMVFAIAFIALAGWIRESNRLEESNKKNESLKKELLIREAYIKKLEGKLIVQTATEHYNEGRKK
jgi:hypothetical protein